MAEFLFGDDDALITVDMGEYHDSYQVSRLFGSAPGYVGYEEGGQLTEKVRRRPFSVVLFDEIEKAHERVYDSLMQVLDEGRMTDGQGREVDFRNTVIIFTSNIGTQDISKPVGMGFQDSKNANESNYQRMQNKVREGMKKHFRPEFLNRIDDVIVFRQLTEDEILQMVDLMLAGVQKQLRGQDLTLEVSDLAKRLLAKRGFDPVLGARPLRRTIQRYIEDELSEKIIFGDFVAGDTIKVDVADWDGEGAHDDAIFTFTTVKSEVPQADTSSDTSQEEAPQVE